MSTNLVDRESCEQLQQLVREFAELGEWLGAYERDLAVLASDHELLASTASGGPWQIHFAVDFSEIYGFAFPFAELLTSFELHRGDPSFLREQALDYLARACLFRKTWNVGPLYLLESYRHELNYHLLQQMTRSRQVSGVEDFVGRLSTELQRSFEETQVASGVGSEQAAVHDAEEAAAFVAAVSHSYPNLVLFVLSQQTRSTQRLREVLGTKVVPPQSGMILSEVRPQSDRVKRWQTALQRLRGEHRRLQSQRDAEALATLEEANRTALVGGKREIHVLVTSTKNLTDVVGAAGADGMVALPDGRQTPLVRRLRLFLAYLRHLSGLGLDERGAPLTEVSELVLGNVQQERQRVCEYLRLEHQAAEALLRCPCMPEASRAVRPADDCPLRAVEAPVRKSIPEIRETREELENAQVILKRNPDLEAYSQQMTQRMAQMAKPEDFDLFLRDLLARLLSDPQLQVALVQYVEELNDQFLTQLLGFNAQVFAYVRTLRSEDLSYLLEFPFYVQIGSEPLGSRLKEALESMEACSTTRNFEGAAQALRELVTYVLRQTLPAPETHLVELLVLLAVGQRELATRLVEKCLERKEEQFAADYTYLRVRTTMETDVPTAQTLCKEALDRYPRDARFWLLGGNLAWRQRSAALEVDVSALDKAIGMTEEGISLLAGSVGQARLLCDLLNNKAYFLAEFGSGRSREAVAAAEEILRLREVAQWASPWLDTYGYALTRQAEDMSQAESLRREWLNKAIRLLESARFRCVGSALCKMVLQHISKARGLLEALEPSDTGQRPSGGGSATGQPA